MFGDHMLLDPRTVRFAGREDGRSLAGKGVVRDRPRGSSGIGELSSLAGELALEGIDIEQCPVHHPLAGAELGERDAGIGAVAAFRGGLDRREIHRMAVAIAEEERVLDVRPRFEPVGMVTEKLARAAHQGDLAVDQYGVQLRGQCFAVELGVVTSDLRKVGSRERRRRLWGRSGQRAS